MILDYKTWNSVHWMETFLHVFVHFHKLWKWMETWNSGHWTETCIVAHITSAFAIYSGLFWTALSVVMLEPPAKSVAWVQGAAKVKCLALPEFEKSPGVGENRRKRAFHLPPLHLLPSSDALTTASVVFFRRHPAIFVVVETGHLYQQNAVEQDLMSENIELVSAF
ncbi:unnamed protein product [Fraxinus pennsylvanica]|uniref:Uncharacterized protein n=1 Tax=Fraxinus pennsylvanica TaxID=56036 RepID=A0AAD1Z0R4_9LAMI|nr:unnamed protein product [Fraxinus pennsylvanica]